MRSAHFSADRADRALALYATYRGREGLPEEIERLVLAESRMRPTDYLMATSIPGWMVKIIGVACEGFEISDACDGRADWAAQRGHSVRKRKRL